VTYTHTVSRETHLLLERYVEILCKWNAKINLIGDEKNIWDRHIWDSYQLIELLPAAAKTLVDLGSGAGLPGLVIAMARPIHVTLVERDQRKSAFLIEAARVLELKNVTVVNADIKTLEAKPYDVVTARALTSLGELCALSHPLMGTNSICLFAKGERHAMELEAARVNWNFESSMHPSVTQPKAAIVSITKLTRVST
jgi:16S rRNA (guanine527-N7)-methyltransferase